MPVNIRDQLLYHGGLAEVLAVVRIAVVSLAAAARVNQNHRRQRPVCDTVGQKVRRVLIGALSVVASVQPVDHSVPPRGGLIFRWKPDVIPDLLVHRGAVIAVVRDARLRVFRLVEPDHIVLECLLIWLTNISFSDMLSLHTAYT